MQIVGPTSHWKTSPVRLPGEKDKDARTNWMLALHAQGLVSPMDKRESPLGIREKPSRTCFSKMNIQAILRSCRLLPNSTEAIPRTSSSRTAVELANMVGFAFFLLHRQGTVALFCIIFLVDFHRESGRTTDAISILQEVSLTGNEKRWVV